MAAVLAKGTTVIDNVAREPEIVDLCEMLVAMGASIGGIGSSTLEIEGVEALSPTTHDVVPDRIVAGTFAFGAAMTRGDVAIRGGRADHLEIALDKIIQAGARSSGRGRVPRAQRVRPTAVDVVTLPYPGFPTDLQPMAIALNAVASGVAFVTENIFEGRFMFIDELSRLGADVRTDGHHAVVRGRERLSGAPVRATDIRAGAGLVLAGLVADGVTTVADVHHIDRGYARFVDQLRALGAGRLAGHGRGRQRGRLSAGARRDHRPGAVRRGAGRPARDGGRPGRAPSRAGDARSRRRRGTSTSSTRPSTTSPSPPDGCGASRTSRRREWRRCSSTATTRTGRSCGGCAPTARPGLCRGMRQHEGSTPWCTATRSTTSIAPRDRSSPCT